MEGGRNLGNSLSLIKTLGTLCTWSPTGTLCRESILPLEGTCTCSPYPLGSMARHLLQNILCLRRHAFCVHLCGMASHALPVENLAFWHGTCTFHYGRHPCLPPTPCTHTTTSASSKTGNSQTLPSNSIQTSQALQHTPMSIQWWASQARRERGQSIIPSHM